MKLFISDWWASLRPWMIFSDALCMFLFWRFHGWHWEFGFGLMTCQLAHELMPLSRIVERSTDRLLDAYRESLASYRRKALQ